MVMKIRATLEIPDRSITRSKLEYPTEGVSFPYLASINMVVYVRTDVAGLSYAVITRDVFADKAVWAAVQVQNLAKIFARVINSANFYKTELTPSNLGDDHKLQKVVGGTATTLGIEAIDIDNSGRGLALSCSGSTIKSMRYEMPNPVDPLALPSPNYTIVATDTSIVAGRYGFRFIRETSSHGGSESGSAWLLGPLTPLPPALTVLEVEVEGSGAPEDPYRPLLSKNLVEIASLEGLPSFLYQEAKKYEILKAKGFTDEEMRILLGSIPQHQVDLEAVTWGAFEFSPNSPTNIIVVTGDNPYQQGAIQKHIELAKNKNLKVLSPPRNYGEAVAQYQRLKRDYKHWLAGKDNYAYQVLGWEELDLFQNIDFYYGELIEHKTHYQQLKQVPEAELWRRLEVLEERLSKVEVLTEERDRHLEKLRSIKRLGW